MNRNERKTVHDLFKQVHANREETPLSDTWHHGVMADIRSAACPIVETGLLQLAPRFAFAGAALSVAGLMAGVWSLPQLTEAIQATYVSQTYDLTATMWTML